MTAQLSHALLHAVDDAAAMESIATATCTGDPVSCFLREMSDVLDAAGICAVWRSDDCADALQFVTPPHPDPAIERVLRALVSSESATQEARWTTTESGDIVHLGIAMDGGLIGLAALFPDTKWQGRAVARRAIERWLPMMRAFFEIWAARFRARSRELAMVAAVNNSDTGTVLLDGAGRTIFVNERAGQMLARKDGLRSHGHTLSGNRLPDTLRLQAAIDHAVQGGSFDRQHAPVIALPRTTGRPLLAAVVPTSPPPVTERDSAAILYLFDPDQDIHALAEPACRLYGLSPVETRLTCLLADGHSLTETASRMRIREQTARSYLKQIFSKTATNRQAELVQLILKSLVRTARRSPQPS